MTEEQNEPRLQYTGQTMDEQFQSARLYQIGIGILQRFGQQMTEDERRVVAIGLQLFARPITGEEGARPQRQPQPVQQTDSQPPVPAQQPVPPRRK